jgi:hypothetical protein
MSASPAWLAENREAFRLSGKRGCHGKRAYRSPERALAALAGHPQPCDRCLLRGPWNAYACRLCGAYHLGHARMEGER